MVMAGNFIRQDESKHWYLIPETKIQEYDNLVAQIDTVAEYSDEWYDLIDRFNDLYSGHRIDDPHSIKFYTEQ